MMTPLLCHCEVDAISRSNLGVGSGPTNVLVDNREHRGYTVTKVPLLTYLGPVLLGGEIMKTVAKGAIRDEKGNVLILVLILLVVGGLVLTPLLGLMSTGLLAGQVYEKKTDELYAADAGVEDAIWRIQTDSLTFDANNYSYLEPLSVNDKSVNVAVYRYDWDPTCGENFTYQIISTVITDDGGGTATIFNSTTIDAHVVVSYLDLSPLLDHAIVSNGGVDIDVDLGGKTTVNGTIWLPDDDPDNYKFGPNVEYDPGKLLDSDDVQITWPAYEDLRAYYLGLLEEPVDPGATINVLYTSNIPDSYRNGPLTIDNTGDPATLTLNGTLYVAGSLALAQSGASKNYTIDLNGNTIFVEGGITAAGQQIRLSGSGCLIAKDDIVCQPGIASEEGEFVLILSVTGDVQINPQGEFTGCIAASGQVDLHPNGTIQWIDPEGKSLDFPTILDPDNLPPVTGTRIESWEIE